VISQVGVARAVGAKPPRAQYKQKLALEKCFREKDLMTLLGETALMGRPPHSHERYP
jgi:hypothetical protein